MRDNIDMNSFHYALAKDIFTEMPTEEEALYFTIIMYSCKIKLNQQARVAEGVSGFEGITMNHAREALARAIRKIKRDNPGQEFAPVEIYHNANPYLDRLPREMLPGMRAMQQKIEAHPWVAKLSDDESDIIELINRS